MLSEITIENVAVIEKATAVFGDGFTVLTGETGAGKSILIDSINAILGSRTSRDILRSGAEKAKIWATFRELAPSVQSALQEAGFTPEEELLLYREITADGKSSCRINGAPATAAMLREVCQNLIDIHGQNDNQSLTNPAKHIDILDAFARNNTQRADYIAAYSELYKAQKEIEALSIGEEEKARKIELLRHETDEIEKAALQPEEEEELMARRDIIRNAQEILQALNSAYVALAGDEEDTPGAATLLGSAADVVNAAAKYAPDLAEYGSTLSELYYTAKEVASDLQHRLASYDFDGGSLEEIEERLDLMYKLKQKYGGSIEAVLTYGEKAWEELVGIEFSSERLEQLKKQEQGFLQRARECADALTASRQNAFEALQREIAEALTFLNMPGIVMALEYKKVPLYMKGQDELEFYISPNPGEAPKPMAKIASGGELARIMLALKSALADRDGMPTVIYDEIDTGISGLAAGRIGQLLQKTAQGRQVICVTHTAQVAAYAAQHLLIQKTVEGGRTFTQINELNQEQRIQELARITSGDHVTDIAKANAFEMLHTAGNA